MTDLSFDDTNDAAPPGIEEHDSAIGRAAALLEAIGQGDLADDSSASYDTDDDDGGDSPAPAPKRTAEKAEPAQAAPSEPGETTRAQRVEEARARLKADADTRRASQAIEQEREAIRKEREELAALRRELEPYQRAMKDPRAFLDLAAEHVSPDDLVTAIPEMTSDEARAKWRTKTTETTLESKIVEAVKAAVEPLHEKLHRLEQEKAAAQEESIQSAFKSRVAEIVDDAPGFASLMQRNPARARELATQVAVQMHKRGELPRYDDDPQAHFDAVALAVEQEFYSGTKREPGSNSDKSSAKRHAAGKANPLSNRAGSDRTSIKTDDGDDEAITDDSLESRARLAERALRGKPISSAF